MILFHDAVGRINATLNEPVPPNYDAFATEQGLLFVHDRTFKQPAERIYSLYYVDREHSPPIVTLRPSYDAAIDKTALAVGESATVVLPSTEGGRLISIDGAPVEDDGSSTFEFAADGPGTYVVSIALWPYLDWTTTITVAEPA